MNKQTLRQQLLKQRAQLSLAERDEATRVTSQKLNQFLKTLSLKPHEQIASYQAMSDGELAIELDPAFKNQRLYPQILEWNQPGQAGRMKFDLNDEYALRVMVIPAVAFTSQGFRLGRGGGFYDRYLAEWKSVRPVCIGVGYDFQLLEDLPHEPHDQKLDWIFTPSHSIQIL